MKKLLSLLFFMPLIAMANPSEEALKNLAPHPRLILTNERLESLKTQAATDTQLQRYVKDVLAAADEFAQAKPLVYEIPDGLRLLGTSRHAKTRIATLAFAYRWTGKQPYADAAIRDMETVCAFKNWNPKHFLDVGEMAVGVAFGYDWLYAQLSDTQRVAITAAITKHALKQKPGGWVTSAQNWNAVCNGGLAVGALAVAESDTPLASVILERARINLPKSIKSYAPDGFWCEGMCYWEYQGEFTIYTIASMLSALDTDFALSQTRGWIKAPNFPIHATSPLKHSSRFGDFPASRKPGEPTGDPLLICPSSDKLDYLRINAESSLRAPDYWHLMWFAQHFDRPEWAAYQNRLLDNATPILWNVIFYRPERDVGALPLCQHFNGSAEMVVMRTSHDDPNAGWLSVKSGANHTPHGQIDAGHFEFEFNGVRWGYDLGRDNYNLPGYFGNKRYTYYRNMAQGHSLMTFKDEWPILAGKVSVVVFDPKTREVTLEMKSAYDVSALASYTRQFQLLDTALILIESVVGTSRLPFHWQMVTDADIEPQSDGSAILRCKGRALKVTVEGLAGLKFTVGDCSQSAPQNPNDGFRLLQLDGVAKDNIYRLQITFTPINE